MNAKGGNLKSSHLVILKSMFALILTLLPSAIFGIEAGLKFIVLLGLTVAVLGRPLLALLFYLLCTILSIGVFYIKYIYHVSFNHEVGIAFFTSSFHEKWSFISQINWEWKIFYLVYVICIIYAAMMLWKYMHVKISYHLRIVLLVLSTFFAGLFWYQLDAPRAFTDYFHGVQPLSWMLTIKQLATIWQQHKMLSDVDKELINAVQHKPLDASQTYVLIIGESARRDRFSLYGYKHDTNPMLKTFPLIVYSDVVSTHSHTPYSVLLMLTKQPLLEEKQIKDASSFMHIFQQAGFKTYWISNQAVMGKYDSPFSVYALKSDEAIFLSRNLDGSVVHDEHLLPEIINILNSPVDKKLIVVHLYGSHPNFEDRYPEKFNEHIDPYDNTILYNDYVIAKIIQLVEAQNNLSGIIYTADHGLHFKECGDTPYHYDAAYNYQVPFLIWLSPEWQQHYSDKNKIVFVNADKKMSTTNVFDSMIGMADIHYPGYQAKTDIFNARFLQKTRWVKNYSHWIDYDKTILAGNCATTSSH